MVDFNKRVYNSIKFSPAAEFYKKHKCYTLAPRGTTDYNTYWEQETDRCLNGYTAPDGDSITGYHYFYLNYSPIMKLEEVLYTDRYGNQRTRRERILDFPRFWDYDYFYYNAIEEAEEEGKHMAVLKSRLRGYEQPYSELIATPDGFVEMGSLKVGDEIWNPDGNTTKVLEIYELGFKDVYQLELADGRTVRCGANHLWEVICANNHFKHKVFKTHDLLNNGLFNEVTVDGKRYNSYKYYLPPISPVTYSEKQQNIPAYTLGALLGDGALTKRTPKISSIDNEILSKIQKQLGDGFEFKYDPTTTCEYRIVDKERFLHKSEFKNGQYGVNRLHRWLEELDLCVSCLYKYIPDNYKYGSVELRYELIRGLMDTDGYISSDGSMSFVNTSKLLIDDFVEVLRSLGLICTVSKRAPGKGGVQNGREIFGTRFSYVVYIKGNPDIFHLSRKRNRIKINRKFSNKVAITNIKYLGEQERQRCILVDNPNHLYVTRDYIPTHNSFKGASMLVRNYELIPGSKNFAVASEQKFLIGDGLLTKAWQIMDFIDKNTAWAKQRLVSTRMERVAGYKVTDEFGKLTEQGYMSSITGITLKNDPERIRGTRGKLVLWEEGGKFPGLLDAWRIEQPSVETDDGIAFGLMVAYGCVCKGTKVWTSSGNCVNIENLKQEDGILGWNTYQAVQQHISHFNPPAKKQCVRITTNTGRTLECSTDHPILWSYSGLTKRVPGKRKENETMKLWKWHEASKCKIGEQIGVIDSIPFFGTKKMWEPRVVGWLIGDGSYGYDKTPRLSNCDAEINEYIETHFDTALDRPSRLTKDGKIYKETRIKGICCKLRELGIYGLVKDKKRLPLNIHEYDAESLAELIGGIFDTDGYILVDKSGRPRITLTQCLETILRQIEEVLIHFGIHCSIRFINTKYREHVSNGRVIKDGPGHWRLTISDITSIGNFAKYITCTVVYKLSALDLMMLYTQDHIAQYHKYVLGVHAEKIINIEDIGEQPIYNLTAKEQNNYICNGIVTHNTGGTEGSSFTGLKELFYKPEAYNVLSFPNIWDDNAEQTKCGFFVPSWSNLESFDDKGDYIYMDKDGNSLREKAIDNLIELRNKIKDGGASQLSIDRFISERPIKPQEAVLELGKNIFPRKLLMDQLTRIRTNTKLRNMKHVVDLNWDGDGLIIATEKKSGDITEYPLKKGDKPHGSIVIWEYPIKDPPFGLYIGGCDPYDHDDSFTNSLGSVFIFKRVKAGEAWNDVIVAEYSGRPDTAEEYYENVRKLLVFYNARLLFENERKGIYPYFTNKHCDYLLADLPDKIISEVFKDSKVQRRKGCHMTKLIRAYGEGLILEWLLEEYEPGHPNVERVYSEPLIQELIENDGIKNVDRVIALCMVMMYREELYQVKVSKSLELNKQVELFEMPLFGRLWFQDNEAQDSTPLFSF